MAQLTITVPDEVVPRIRMAMGTDDPLTNQRVPATVAELQAAIKRFIKSQVINYETTLSALSKREEISNENWDG